MICSHYVLFHRCSRLLGNSVTQWHPKLHIGQLAVDSITTQLSEERLLRIHVGDETQVAVFLAI